MTDNLEVHPVADLFPMLADDELQDLAADIKERGLIQPIVLDTDGRILDGRNRHAACLLAGVAPEFVTYDGSDPNGYALSVNIARRHLTKGQQAMVIVKAAEQYKLYSQGQLARDAGIPQPRFSQAKIIFEFASELADGVISGAVSLDAACETARDRKRALEELTDEVTALRAEAPDLADEVTEERLTLAQATEQLEQRRTDAEIAGRVAEVDKLLAEDGDPYPSFSERAAKGELTWPEADTLARQWERERDEAIDRDVARIQRVAGGWGSVFAVLDAPDRPRMAEVLKRLGPADHEVLERIKTQSRELAKRKR